jgi:hypothetical protein
MGQVVPPRRWKRASAAVCLSLILGAVSPARGEVFGPPVPESNSRTLPLPAPGTERLIRIGPQALIREDEHGRLSMVDESTPPPKVGRSLVTTTAFFSIMGFGALLMLGDPYYVGFESGRYGRPVVAPP